MRRFAVLLLLWPVIASAQEGKNHSYFFKCEKDSDCTVVPGVCYGHFSAVNKRFAKEVGEYWQSIAPSLDCQGQPAVPEHTSDFITHCNAKKICELKKK